MFGVYQTSINVDSKVQAVETGHYFSKHSKRRLGEYVEKGDVC